MPHPPVAQGKIQESLNPDSFLRVCLWQDQRSNPAGRDVGDGVQGPRPGITTGRTGQASGGRWLTNEGVAPMPASNTVRTRMSLR